jgi:hypothetical protein
MNRRGHREPAFRSHQRRELFLGILVLLSPRFGHNPHVPRAEVAVVMTGGWPELLPETGKIFPT